MDISPSDYLFHPDHVQQQDESVPFIGDLFDKYENEFFPVEEKELTVVDASFVDGKLIVYVRLNTDQDVYRNKKLDMIAGTVISVPGQGSKPIELFWLLEQKTDHAYPVEFDVKVYPGPCSVEQYLMDEVPKSYIKMNTPVNFLNFTKEIDEIQSRIDEVGIASEDIITTQDDKLLLTYTKFIAQYSGAVKLHVRDSIIRNLSSNNWVQISFLLVKQYVKMKDLQLLMEDKLGSMKGRYASKRQMCELFQQKNAGYISSNEEWKYFLENNSRVCAFLFYEHLLMSNVKAMKLFFDFVEKYDVDGLKACAVDLDCVSVIDVGGQSPKDIVTRIYEDGVCTHPDLQRMIEASRYNIVSYTGIHTQAIPKRRALLNLICPGNFRGQCPAIMRKWLCNECRSQLYYSYDDNVWCDRCGTTSINDCRFQCESGEHGAPMALTPKQIVALQDIPSMEERTILLLGQSGVGKSTWINSIVNYMSFTTLEKAETCDVLAPIPSKFVISNDAFQPVTVYAGLFEDEVEVGASVTQDCAKYSVLYNDMVINLIDSPGLGDSRGIEEDRKNIKKILDYIRHVDLIHGICLLLKPNETRISVLLSYCLKEILSNLHQSSSNNLLFCFTNSRSTFYKPGETLPILNRLLAEIGVTFTLHDRVFCFDNEAFKYLCCKNTSGITFKPEEHDSFSKSWVKSRDETVSLLDRISAMNPHRTHDTWSLNRARRIILSLTKPIGEITRIIEDNICQHQLHKTEIESCQDNLKKLRTLSAVPQLILEAVPLGYPRTVCTSEGCVRYALQPKTKTRLIQYVQHCHVHCYLRGVTPEVYPNRDLLGCAAMSGTNYCTECKCSWETHMHLTYDQVPKEVMEKDDTIEKAINDAKTAAEAKAVLLAQATAEIQRHEDEKRKILQLSAQFAHFLRNNAIAGYNDALCDYLRFLIDKEEMKPYRTQMENQKIEKMKETKALYEEELKIFAAAAKEGGKIVSAETIGQCERELYELPIYGRQLHQIMTVAFDSENKAQGSHNVKRAVPQKKNQSQSKGKKKGIGASVLSFFTGR